MNSMDKLFQNNPNDGQMTELLNRAMQNPQAFADYLAKVNPAAYQKALNIRNSPNPQAIIMNMAKSSGINPAIFKMLGIN